MISRQKLIKPLEEPLFKTDIKTGTLIPLPRKWLYPGSSKLKSSEMKSKGTLTLTPLILTAADMEEPPNRANKIRKVDNSARKILSKRSQISRPLTTRQTSSRKNFTPQKVNQKNIKPNALSPILDMEEVEEKLTKRDFLKGYPFATPKKPAIKFSENLKSISLKAHLTSNEQNIPEMVVTQITPDALPPNESEYLQLDKIYCVDDPQQKIESNKSSISSVYNLLEGTMINSNWKQEKIALGCSENVQQSIVDNLENLLIESDIALEEYKTSHERNISKITELLETERKHCANFAEFHEKNKDIITGLLKKLKHANPLDHIKINKENTPVRSQRSLRLLNKSSQETQGAKVVVSPVVFKNRDLRKTTLAKNLETRTQQYGTESSRIKKASDMYNSMRCEIPVLVTPTSERKYLNESPKTIDMCRNLSIKVQNQCLLLQDTPIYK